MTNVVIGGGPSGLFITWYLAHKGREVYLIEKDDILGGSWNSDWDLDYFTENSPRILFLNSPSMDFFREIGMSNEDFENVYGGFFQTMLKISHFLFQYINLIDFSKIVYCLLTHNDRKEVMSEWMDNNNISDKGKIGLSILCITACDVPEKTNVIAFFNSMFDMPMWGNIIQFRDSNKWHKIIEQKLSNFNNVHILKESTVKSLVCENNKVYKCIIQSKENGLINLHGDTFILCTQSSGLSTILENSDKLVQNNWMDYSHMK